jgi:hydrogenase-4 component F
MNNLFSPGALIIMGVVLPPFLAAVASLFGKRRSLQQGILTFIASVLSFCFSVALVIYILQQPLHIFQFTFLTFQFFIDALSTYFILLVNIVALFASYFTIFMMRQSAEVYARNDDEAISSGYFHLQFNLFHVSMLLVPIFDNLVLLWVLITVTTVVSAPLIDYRQDRRAQEAAWKYIMISSSGIVFALLGTIFLVQGLSPIDLNWSGLTQGLKLGHIVVSPHGQGIIELSFLLILLGYGTKAGLFPMHTWLPDGHGEAPSPVSALLSGVLLKSALYVILRFYVITNLALAKPGQTDPFASNVLLIFGLLSLIMATPFILNTKKENRFKRVLAYHSLEHMGIITFGIGLGSALGFFGALFHALNHALNKALMFLTYGKIQATYAQEDFPDEEIRGVFQLMPVTGSLLALGGLALVGMPFFSIFLSEFIILWAAFQKAIISPYMIPAICLFLISVTLIFAGLVAHLGRILLGKSPIQRGKVREPRVQLIVLCVLLLLLIIGGFTTFPLTALLQQSSNILCQGVCP